jgi:hypothetical protein
MTPPRGLANHPKQPKSTRNNTITNKNKNYLTYIFRPFAVRLEIELRCILFALIIHWSPPVVLSIG